jgi:hypothetical protein
MSAESLQLGGSKNMANLSNPTLTIKLISGTNNADVTATVVVKLTAFELNLVKNLGLKFKLKARLWGQDGGFNGGDDDLFSFSTQTISAGGTFTFKTTVSRNVLDEDWGNDEIYAKFTLQSAEPIFALSISKTSPVISGNF